MYIYIYIIICVHVYVYALVCIYMYIYVCSMYFICTYIYNYLCMFACMYVCNMYVCITCMHIHNVCMYIHTYVYTYVHTYVHSLYMSVCMYICTWYIHMCMYSYATNLLCLASFSSLGFKVWLISVTFLAKELPYLQRLYMVMKQRHSHLQKTFVSTDHKVSKGHSHSP